MIPQKSIATGKKKTNRTAHTPQNNPRQGCHSGIFSKVKPSENKKKHQRYPLLQKTESENRNTSNSTVELSDGKIIRKSDIASLKSKSSQIRSSSGNISFPFFSSLDIEVDMKGSNQRKTPTSKKCGPKTRKQIELALRTTTPGRAYPTSRRFSPEDSLLAQIRPFKP